MITLTRQEIQRMTIGRGNAGSGGSGGASVDLSGYMTIEQAQQQFVSIDFFKRLFQAHGTDENDDPIDVDPNDTETTITDIEAMFGFWTEQYLSALGNGGGGGTGGSTALSDLVDVALSNPTNGQALVYNATTGKWTNQTIGGGADMATVWSALAAGTNEQINASHLANALSGYAQTSALANYLPIAGGTVTGNLSVGGTLAVTGAATLSSSITAGSFIKSGGTASQFLKADGSVDNNTYATQTWVEDNYVSIAFFSRLFKAYNGNTLVSPNNTTATINNIKAMFGFWTEQYLSALGRGSGGTGGSTALSDLVDVALSNPTNGQALVYNSTSGKWTNQTIGGGGTDMATVWSALAAGTNEQINASHLTNALSGYAQTSALANYLPIAGGTLTGEVITSSPITINGYNGRTFGITPTSSGHQGDNVDVGWNWTDKDGAGAFFRSTDANSNPGSFSFYARNSAGTTKEFIGKPDGALTWGNDNILHTGNFATEVGASLFTALTSTNATNLSVTIGGTTKTITNLYALRLKGVQVKEDTVSYGDLNSLVGTSYSVVTNYNTNNSWQHAPTIQTDNYWGGAIVVKGQDSNLMMQLFWNAKHNEATTPTGKLWFRARAAGGWGDDWKEIAFADGNIATATALATSRTLWGQSFDGTSDVTGTITVGNGDVVLNNNKHIYFKDAGGTNRDVLEYSTTGNLHLGYGTASAESNTYINGYAVYIRYGTARSYGLTLNSSGNVGIGTTTPEYKLHVSGVAAAQSFRSTVETGTAPLVVASSTLVTNLNADRLDGKHASDFATASDMTTLQGYFDASGNARNALRLTTVSKTAWGQTYWTANGVPTNISGDMSSVGSITCTNNSRISNATGSGGSLYIGRADDAGWVKMSDMCSRQGDSYWKIKSNGDATFSNMLSNGYVTALSDARYKTIVGDVDLRVEQIAAMPAIRYRWNERRDNGLYVGSIAQDWQTILPEVVMTSDDEQRTLSLSYGVAALLASITTARKVVDHEQRIAQLEKENTELRNELNKIKAA